MRAVAGGQPTMHRLGRLRLCEDYFGEEPAGLPPAARRPSNSLTHARERPSIGVGSQISEHQDSYRPHLGGDKFLRSTTRGTECIDHR